MKNNKIIALALVIIVLAAGTYFYLGSRPKTNSYGVVPSSQPVVQTGNSSDAQIDADLNTAGTNLNNLDSQSSNVDSSINQSQTDPTSGF